MITSIVKKFGRMNTFSRLSILLLLLCPLFVIESCSTAAQRLESFKAGSEPDGFRGLKWESDISALKDMVYKRTGPSYGGLDCYTRETDSLTMGSATLERIDYCFQKGKLSVVLVFTRGYDNFSGLRAAVFEEFGWGHQPNQHILYYIWHGRITEMKLWYGTNHVGVLFIKSEKFRPEKELKVMYAQK